MSLSRALISGTSQLMFGAGIVRLCSIVSMPILTYLLSPQAYGAAALVSTVISLVSVFGGVGIEMSYARAYHSAQPPSGASVERFCWRFAALGAFTASWSGAVVWWLITKDFIDLDRRLAVLVALGVLLSGAEAMAQTRARLSGRYRAMSLANIVNGIIGVAGSIGIAFLWRQDALALLLPPFLGCVISVLMLGTPSTKELLKPSGLNRKEGANLIKIGLAGVVTSPMYWLVSSSDRWFLQHYHGANTVGTYSLGFSVAIFGMLVNNAVMSVWLPEAAREFEQNPERARVTLGRLMDRLIVLMALTWLAVTAAGGDIVRWLADERFHAAAGFVPYIAGGVFFYGVLHLANAILLLAKKLNWAALWWLAGGLICTVLNIALVPKYDGVGAAITQCASFGLISLAIFATAQFYLRLHFDSSRLLTALAIVLSVGILLTPSWHGIAPISLFMKLPVGMTIALIVTWLMAPEWCIKGISYLRRWAVT